MTSFLFGIGGIVFGLLAYDGVDKSSGLRALGFGALAVVLFIACIAATGSTSRYSSECTRFSSFASSCS